MNERVMHRVVRFTARDPGRRSRAVALRELGPTSPPNLPRMVYRCGHSPDERNVEVRLLVRGSEAKLAGRWRQSYKLRRKEVRFLRLGPRSLQVYLNGRELRCQRRGCRFESDRLLFR